MIRFLGHPQNNLIEFPEVGDGENCLSPEAKDIIDKLLEPDPAKRLGSGARGVLEIKEHSFFKGIDWENIRSMKPPLAPKKGDCTQKRREQSLEVFLPKGAGGTYTKSIKSEKIEVYRIDLLHADNLRAVNEFLKSVEEVKNRKNEVFDKLHAFEEDGDFIVF